ncbi:unnamed protein product [Paramecium octaurelia]|uniref:Uncharacterized protein n=1 Tax=Paramecium octaurelia TaxID=43137 RepID=A0A8S1WFB8_PAROT|nr:unnamed protein product [Paramecium octaurelia]
MGVCCINPNKNQKDQSVIILLFLSEESQKAVKEQFKEILNFSFDKLMIFSNYKYNQQILFVTNGRNLSSPEDVNLYLKNCSLEGNLRQIIVLCDTKTFKADFNKFSFVKRLQQDSQLKGITSLFFLIHMVDTFTKRDLTNLNLLAHNVQIVQQTELKDSFQKTFEQQNYSSPQLTLNLQQPKPCEKCVEMVQQFINNKKKYNSIPTSCRIIDFYFDMLIDIRNQGIYQQCKACNKIADKTLKNRNALYCKFNIEIIKLLKEFTDYVFQKIEQFYKQFLSEIKCCVNCKTIVFVTLNRYEKIEFFQNLQFRCLEICNFKDNIQEIQQRYKAQLELFTMNTTLQNLQKKISTPKQTEIQQQQLIERQVDKHDQELGSVSKGQLKQVSNLNVNSQSNSEISEIENKHIMLIGKSGVGKTSISHKLSQYEDCCQNAIQGSFIVIDTPPFELVDEQKMANSSTIDDFSNIFRTNKISKIFIVTDFDRIDVMKKKIMECYKFLEKFQKILTIIILNLFTKKELRQPSQEMMELQNYFDLECLFFNITDKVETFREKITNTLNSSTDDYLDLSDTKFDKKKYQLITSQYEEKLMFMKNQQQIQKIQEEIQNLIQKNKEKEKQKIKILKKKKELESDKEQLLKQLQQIFQKIENIVENQNEIETQDQKIDKEQKELEMEVLRLEKQKFELKCKKN